MHEYGMYTPCTSWVVGRRLGRVGSPCVPLALAEYSPFFVVAFMTVACSAVAGPPADWG